MSPKVCGSKFISVGSYADDILVVGDDVDCP